MQHITERALIARLNRRLADDGQQIKTCREGSRSFPTLGRYYIVRIDFNAVDTPDIDLEGWGREMGVLRDNESLAD